MPIAKAIQAQIRLIAEKRAEAVERARYSAYTTHAQCMHNPCTSFHPSLGAAAHPDIEGVADAGDDDHPEGEGVAEVRIAEDVAADLGEEQDRHDREEGAGQRVGGGDR